LFVDEAVFDAEFGIAVAVVGLAALLGAVVVAGGDDVGVGIGEEAVVDLGEGDGGSFVAGVGGGGFAVGCAEIKLAVTEIVGDGVVGDEGGAGEGWGDEA